jgi:hypothetical protein
VILLQEHEDIPDDDVLAVLQEFEENMAAVDMYLALRTDRLRVGYLKTLIARRSYAAALRAGGARSQS